MQNLLKSKFKNKPDASVNVNCSEFEVNKFTIVLFFVDGGHEYVSVKRELEMILHNVDNHSILLHGTFYQSPESMYNVGSYQAILDTIRGKENLYKLISTQTGLPGMTLLFKK